MEFSDVLPPPLGELSLGRLCFFLNQTSRRVLEVPLPPDCPVQLEFYLYRVQWVVVFVALLLVYLLYYRVRAVAAPQIVCADSERLAALKEHCPAFFERYWPTAWALPAYMQTIGRAIIQIPPKPRRRREEVRMKDGGHVCLDWYNEEGPDQPTVLMLPGTTGSSDESYIRHWIDSVTEAGYRSVVFNYRGFGKTKLSTPKLSCAADTSDLSAVTQHIHSTVPHSPLIAVGASLGCIKVIKYVTDCKRQGRYCPLQALLLISVPWVAEETERVLQSPLLKYTLNRYLCNNFKKLIRENKGVFDEYRKRGELCFNYDRAMKCTCVRDFAIEVLLPMFNFSDTKAMAREASPHYRLSDIAIPVVALNAADDPYCPPHVICIPEKAALSNPNLVLVTTRRGGHIGFMEGLVPLRKTLMDRVLVQFAVAVFEHKVLLQNHQEDYR